MKNKSKKHNHSEHELELGKYLDSDMVTLTDDEVNGGVTPAISVVVSGYISSNTCPTTACTRAC